MGFWTGFFCVLLALLGMAAWTIFSLIGRLSAVERCAMARVAELEADLADERQARQHAQQLRREEARRTAETVQKMEREAKALQGQLDIANQILRKAGRLREDS